MKTTPKAICPQGSNQKTRATKSAHPAKQDGGRYAKYTLAVQWIMRACVPILSANQSLVLLFIADRTLGWGKESETITRSHFLNGIPSKKNEDLNYAGRLPMTKNTMVSSLAHLIKIGLVKTTKSKAFTAYRINLDWSEFSNEELAETTALTKLKRRAELQSLQTPDLLLDYSENEPSAGAKIDPLRGQKLPLLTSQKLPPKKDKEKNGKEKKIDPSDLWRGGQEGNQEASLEDRLDSATSLSRASSYWQIDKWTLDSVVPAWQAALALHHPGSSILTNTRVQCMALLRYGKKWIAAVPTRSIADWLTYLNWCIAKWVAIRAEHFHWMTSSPEVPAMGFLVKMADRFEQAYTAKESLEAMGRLSTRERSIERRTRAGMDREAAEKEVDDRTGLTHERERIEAAAQAIKRQRLAIHTDEREREATARRKANQRAIRERTKLATSGTFDTWL